MEAGNNYIFCSYHVMKFLNIPKFISQFFGSPKMCNCNECNSVADMYNSTKYCCTSIIPSNATILDTNITIVDKKMIPKVSR